MVYLQKPLWMMVFILAGVIYGSKENYLNKEDLESGNNNEFFNFPKEEYDNVNKAKTELIQTTKEIKVDTQDTTKLENNKVSKNNIQYNKKSKTTRLIQIENKIKDDDTKNKIELQNNFEMENNKNQFLDTFVTTDLQIEKEIIHDETKDEELEKMLIELNQPYNKNLGEKLARYCTTCARCYADNKLFQVDSKNGKECASCIFIHYPITRIDESFKYKDITLEKILGSQKRHKDGYVLAQFSANLILFVEAIYMWINSAGVPKDASGIALFTAATIKLLPFAFGSHMVMTIVHTITKYGSRIRHTSKWEEFPLGIIPERGAFFQLFIAVVSSIFYWGLQEYDMTERVVAIYGFFLTLSLWTGQNLGLEFHNPIYVNDHEFGFQKLTLRICNRQISQSTLARAWIQDKDAWNLAKPFFVFYQLFTFLNFVASCSLVNALVQDPEAFGENVMGGVYVSINLGTWIICVLGLLVKLMMGTDQGPVFSMNNISRLGMMSAYAGLNTMSLYTKFLMNLISLALILSGYVIPWKAILPSRIHKQLKFN